MRTDFTIDKTLSFTAYTSQQYLHEAAGRLDIVGIGVLTVDVGVALADAQDVLDALEGDHHDLRLRGGEQVTERTNDAVAHQEAAAKE